MSQIKGRNTKPEIAVRKLLFSMGYRYRLHRKDLPGKPDIVFSSKRKAIFVHGCFWHQHNSPRCPLVAKPGSNKDFWDKKLKGNIERDKRNLKALKDLGWDVFTIWECELKDIKKLQKSLNGFMNQ
jgi:DNA mismatch endonuclease (patch repair protein)